MKRSRRDYVFFSDGPFAQESRYPIVIHGVKYICNEQYMMAEKARLFDDYRILSKIMNSDDVGSMQALGRIVDRFDQARWEAERERVVFDANLAKFTQYADLKKELIETGDKIIVYAVPSDIVWGVGLSSEHSDITDPDLWRGKNLLGDAIMKVRDEIKSRQS